MRTPSTSIDLVDGVYAPASERLVQAMSVPKARMPRVRRKPRGQPVTPETRAKVMGDVLMRRMRRAKAREDVKAAELVLVEEKLTEQELKELLTPSREQLDQLRKLAAGGAHRHAGTVLGALKIMLEHTVAKPKVETGLEGAVTVVVNKVVGEAAGGAYQMPAEGTSGTKGPNA